MPLDDDRDLANRIILSESQRIIERAQRGLRYLGMSKDLSVDDDIGYYKVTLKGAIKDLTDAVRYLGNVVIKPMIEEQ